MKKKYVICILCISFFITGCSKTDGKTSTNKDFGQVENTVSENLCNQVKNDYNNSEYAGTERENYEAYSGFWTVDGISHETVISDGGTEFSATITNGTELKGYLYSQQGTSGRIAEIDNITADIENNECYYDFTDDGWGGTGTLYIQFMENSIGIEVQNYKMDDKNLSGFGITGVYPLERADKFKIEKAGTELSEQDLQNAVYDRYYSKWSEDSMLAAIEERNQYLERCSFYKEVLEYMENIREVKDIANVAEPLYHTDMKYYKSQDFEKDPSLIIHLAKNEIYARHGYIFENEDLNNYFMGQLWYEPSCIPEDFDDSVFNEYDTANLKLLASLDTYS